MIEINLHHNGWHPTTQDWDSVPNLELLQGGKSGIVFSSKGNYTTAFVEAFVDGTFIRGQGATLEEAELSAWNQWKARSSCGIHEWEARGYKNGAGFCKNCNTFQSNVFTGEDLGQYCKVCSVPTTDSWDTYSGIFGCRDHVVENSKPTQLEALFNALSDGENNDS